jgi:predicted XRE-type DNA-binding protein
MHTTPAGKDIFDDLGYSPEKAASLKIRRDLMRALVDAIRERGLTQAKAAKLFGVSQPRVSDLVRGRISLLTIDALVSMLAKAGINVEVSISTSHDG